MNGLKSETVRQRKTIYQLEKEREKYGIEASEQRSLYVQSMEEVKLRDMRINELQKKVSEWESKLKQQQQLYESVRSDRNLYSKNLIEAQDEVRYVPLWPTTLHAPPHHPPSTIHRPTIQRSPPPPPPPPPPLDRRDEAQVQDHEPSDRAAQGGDQ